MMSFLQKNVKLFLCLSRLICPLLFGIHHIQLFNISQIVQVISTEFVLANGSVPAFSHLAWLAWVPLAGCVTGVSKGRECVLTEPCIKNYLQLSNHFNHL